ncbi:hypothetical protein RJ640_000770, partial [Escallonia rubra]
MGSAQVLFWWNLNSRLRSLVIKFEEYTKDPKHTMSEYLRVMSNMIGKLRDAGHALTYEQEVRAVIRSLLALWATMKHILTHNENIKNFYDVLQHVTLDAETRDADKTLTYVAQEGSGNANGKRRRQSATKHVARDQEGFIDYHRIPVGGKHIFMGINSSEEVLESSSSYVVNDNIVNDSATCHARLGHISQDRMTRLAREDLLGPLAKVNLQTCEACLAGKTCRKPFGKAVRATQPLELVHSDICGPM